MIEFYLDTKSGVAPYLQLVQQVRRALKLGLLHEGDQLPTVKDVVGRIAINPNTVSKAYRELEHEGLVAARTGVGTFVALGLNQIVGHAVKELRPYNTLHHVLVLVPKANDYAFPSDHAVVAGALVASVLMVSRRAAPHVSRARPTATDELRSGSSVSGDGHFVPILLTLGLVNAFFGLLLCFARVYVGAHYPVDVVAGFLLGALVVVVISLARPIAYRMVDVIEPTPFGVLLRRPLKA